MQSPAQPAHQYPLLAGFSQELGDKYLHELCDNPLNHSGQPVTPRLINEHTLWALSTGLLFNSGPTSVRHCLIRLSSRWVARSRGFWGVHSIFFSKRDTWDLE